MIGLSAKRRVGLFCVAFVVVTFCLCVGLTWPTIKIRLAVAARRALKLAWVDPDLRAPSGTKYRTFFSRTIQREVSYLIYLPPDYESAPEKRYPVIYWLYSRGGTQARGRQHFRAPAGCRNQIRQGSPGHGRASEWPWCQSLERFPGRQTARGKRCRRRTYSACR